MPKSSRISRSRKPMAKPKTPVAAPRPKKMMLEDDAEAEFARKTAVIEPKKTATGKKVCVVENKTGAPAQHNQKSRKGKKAWRKNVNIEDLEAGLEETRAEERVVGTALHNLMDSELFEVDVKGDDKVRHILPKFSSAQLTSTKILAQRSAIPAVFSRPSTSISSTGKRKAGTISKEEKDKLMRIAKRPRKGPFNSVMDPSELQSGEGVVELSEAVKQSGGYDPWAEPEETEKAVEIKDGLETVQPKTFKPPATKKAKDTIEVAAVVEPHQGTSYNPPVGAHLELLRKAHEIEERKVQELERTAETKKKMDAATEDADVVDITVPAGMKLDVPMEEDSEGAEANAEERLVQKQPKPKTKSQRTKAAKVLAEKRALAEAAARKRLMVAIDQAKGFRRSSARQVNAQEKATEAKRSALYLKLKSAGLAGQKLGKHKVPESQVEVQLGEDLSESLRGLKPEGNLFRDRFQSLQQRALIEPRVRVLPKRRKNKIIEYEKHAWKKFE